jgi:hypothetical protein
MNTTATYSSSHLKTQSLIKGIKTTKSRKVMSLGLASFGLLLTAGCSSHANHMSLSEVNEATAQLDNAYTSKEVADKLIKNLQSSIMTCIDNYSIGTPVADYCHAIGQWWWRFNDFNMNPNKSAFVGALRAISSMPQYQGLSVQRMSAYLGMQ